MREHAPAPPELLMRFVLGRCLAADVSYLLDEEHRVYGDLHRFKHAKDGFRSAHVIKTYEWYIYAKGLDTRWVAKADDDTLWNVPLLLAELRLLTGKHAHAYHGVMRWRWYSTVDSAVCGAFVEHGPPKPPPAARVATSVAKCGGGGTAGGGVLGPFVYSDGSFELLSTPLARAAFAPTARRWHRQFLGMSKRGWTAEDPLVGALVYEESVRQQLPTAFYALRPWRHSRFWVDLREARTLPDATILGARSPTPRLSRLGPCVCTFAAQAVPSLEVPSIIPTVPAGAPRVQLDARKGVGGALLALRNGANASSYVQYDCGKCSEWGWQQGTSKFACCMKRPCAANDPSVPLASCGLV